ncbi:PEP-CTERM sorting domain-containing protein [Pannus brasiliensis CCIBt3594]|uniref:PEP-CTERM sorting domain-containing protein n=1 Tax=Pannus brasiliensis CCIBt3594 TaxID=1427578 RepID=A0AAW9QSL8_9CHRO
MTPIKFNFSLPLALSLATGAIATLSDTASAALFNLSYTSSGGTITATVDGTLQPDNDTVFVTAISNLTFNGSPAPALPFVGTYSNFISSSSVVPPAVLSLSGASLDFIASDSSANFSSVFAFIPANLFAPVPLFGSGLNYGETSIEPFVLANYSLTPAGSTPVPEPSAAIALAVMGGAFLWGKRKK